jgi:DNA polymerase elongation subunit (family B)
MGYSSKRGLENGKKIRLLDPERNEIDIKSLVQKHLGNPKDCFVKGWLSEREREEERKIDTNNEKDILYNKIVNTSKLFQISKDSRKNIIPEIYNNNLEQLTIPESFMGQRTLDPVKVAPTLRAPARAPQLPTQPEVTLTPTVIPNIEVFPKTLTDHVSELNKPGYFDMEWYQEDKKENIELKRSGHIYCFCSVSEQGEPVTLHLKDYPDRHAFMSAILDVIKKFTSLIGYSIYGDWKFKTDMDHIKSNCKDVGLEDRHTDIMTRIKCIDLQKVFGHKNVRTFLDKGSGIKYDGADLKVSLDDVARAYIHESKPEGITGKNVESKPPHEQIAYCLNDAVLSYKLLAKNNFELIQIIQSISQDIKLPFFETINGGYTSTWAAPKLTSLSYPETTPEVRKFNNENIVFEGNSKKFKYVGGNVLEPVVGIFPDAVELDINSNYPTMCIVHNISGETINCPHPECKRDGLVPDLVMKIINDYIADPKNKSKGKPREHYWICQKKDGILRTTMQNYFNQKMEHKKNGDTVNEKEVKIMMNSLYGSFGSPYFKFADLRVAELITGFGNYTHRKLVEFAGEDVLRGDTDSLCLRKMNNKIIKYAKDELGVTLELEERYHPLFLTSNKKQHIGLTDKGEVVATTMTGSKSNYPPFFGKVSEKLISKEFLESFNHNDKDTALKPILEYIRSTFKELAELPVSELFYTELWQLNLWEYKNDVKQKKIYKEILEDCNGDKNIAQGKSQAEQIWRYWKVKAKGKSFTLHPERYQIDMEKYRDELFNTIEPTLETFGVDKIMMEDLRHDLVIK